MVKSVRKIKNLRGSRILLRSDFNVPMQDGKIEDDYKIVAGLSTIRFLLNNKCKVIVATHLGEPKFNKGKLSAKDRGDLSTKNLALRLGKLLGRKVDFANDCIGKEVERKVRMMKEGDILFLENLRFYPEEETDNKAFAKELAKFADIYINNAFAVSHRKHASVSAIKKYLPAYAGFLVEQEVRNLDKILLPEKPFVVVMGGAKISSKLRLLEKFAKNADHILLSGALANTLLSILGHETGKSKVEKKDDKLVQALLKFYKKNGSKKIIFPVDFLVTQDKAGKGKTMIKTLNGIGKGDYIFDVGPKTISLYAKSIKKAKSIIWNGPLGMFENKHFKHGTLAVAKIIAAKSTGVAFGVVGGGETVEALKMTKMFDYVDWVSTGGGAMLSYLSGEDMPGLKNILK